MKQSGRMWYNRLSEFLLKRRYANNDVCPCVFINGFCIISVYIDDINVIGTHKELTEASSCLKTEFETKKTWGKPSIVSTCRSSMFLKKYWYTSQPTWRRSWRDFKMNKSHELSTPMVVKSLEVDKDPYKPKEDNEDILGPEVPYLSALLKHLFILQIIPCLILHLCYTC